MLAIEGAYWIVLVVAVVLYIVGRLLHILP